MDSLTFWSQIVKSIAWPLVVVFVVFWLRQPLSDIIRSLQNLKYKGFELYFNRRLHEVAVAQKEGKDETCTRPVARANEKTILETYEDKRHYIREIAKIDPGAGVDEAWKELNASVMDFLGRRVTDPDGRRKLRFGFTFNNLLKDNASESQFYTYTQLQDLRNQLSHVGHDSISEKSALAYVDIALELAEKFRTSALPQDPKSPGE